MPLTQEQIALIVTAINQAIGDTPAAPAPLVPWYKDTSGPAPTTPLANADDETADKKYAAYGLKIDLSRGVAAQDMASLEPICDAIARAKSPEEAELAIKNAGKFTADVAIYLVRTGCTQGFSSFMTPMIFCNPAVQSIKDAALYAVQKWNGGAGPGLG